MEPVLGNAPQSRGRNTSPKWPPDGKRISFDHASQDECDIFLIGAHAS
jgi:Tol biopolymer transport system component